MCQYYHAQTIMSSDVWPRYSPQNRMTTMARLFLPVVRHMWHQGISLGQLFRMTVVMLMVVVMWQWLLRLVVKLRALMGVILLQDHRYQNKRNPNQYLCLYLPYQWNQQILVSMRRHRRRGAVQHLQGRWAQKKSFGSFDKVIVTVTGIEPNW